METAHQMHQKTTGIKEQINNKAKLIKEILLRYGRELASKGIIIGYWFIIAHLVAMVFYPLIMTGFDLHLVLQIWKDWQILNASIIALASSVIGFHATQIHEEHQRRRNFIAARAFLPDAYRQISRFCDEALHTYANVWKNVPEKTGADAKQLKRDIPAFPSETFYTIKEAVRYADENFASYLTRLLNLIQILQSRMEGHFQYVSGSDKHTMLVTRQNLLSDMLTACYIKAMIEKSFGFARGEDSLDDTRPEQRDVIGAFRTANLIQHNYPGLDEFFKNHIHLVER